ncbi:MAG: sulfatase [Planctomycetota bacterium]
MFVSPTNRPRAGAHVKRPQLLLFSLALLVGSSLTGATAQQKEPPQRPNIVLLMADDLGYGDLGCQGHPHLHTPHLDQMAQDGVRFTRFHAAAPVCSPTRASCLTGRHPYRCDVPFANAGHLQQGAATLPMLAKQLGYRTGHFGKWHLGTLTTTVRDSNRGGPKHADHFSPPWQHAFDVCFSTEAKVPTLDPMKDPKTGKPFGTRYWNERGEVVTGNLAGDDSRVIMDRVVPFVRESAAEETPFLAVVWFHAPHLPVLASAADRERYREHDEATQHYYGCITALDREVGRLRTALEEAGLRDNTVLWFCSDNGPEGQARKAPGSTGGLRGRKRSLFEGGTRVPAMLTWPAMLAGGQTFGAPACTSDILPTLAAWLGAALPSSSDAAIIDGVDLAPMLAAAKRGEPMQRARPIGFESRRMAAWVDGNHKLVAWLRKPSGKGPSDLPAIERVALFDLDQDPAESSDIGDQHPERTAHMKQALQTWRESVRRDR